MYEPKNQKVTVRPAVRNGRILGFLKGLTQIFILVVTLGALVGGINYALKKSRTSNTFLISDIIVRGCNHISSQTVVLCGQFDRTMNAYDANARREEITERIKSLPDVRDVTMSINYPSNLVLSVVERTPVARIAGEDGVILPIDSEGHVMSGAMGDLAADMALITGSGERVRPGHVCKEAVRTALRYLYVIENSPTMNFPRVRSLDLSDPAGIELATQSVDRIILDGEYSDEAVAKVFQVMEELRNLRRTPAKIDARYQSVAVVCKKL